MKHLLIIFFLLSYNSFLSAQQLDDECSQIPGPLKIDCPNDPYFLDQWAADYMDFARGWYYTKANAHVAILDSYSSYDSEYMGNVRSIGLFGSYNRNDFPFSTTSKPYPCYSIPNNSNQLNIGKYTNIDTMGSRNTEQYDFTNYPNIFINEVYMPENGVYHPSTKDFIEIAVKENIDISNITIEIDNSTTLNLSDFQYTSNTNDFGYRFLFYEKSSESDFQLFAGTGFMNTISIKSNNQTLFSYNFINITSTRTRNLPETNTTRDSRQVYSCSRYFTHQVQKPFNPSIFSNNSNHGSMILSLLGSESNNETGISSFCPNCELSYYDFVDHKSIGRYDDDPNLIVQVNEAQKNMKNSLDYTIASGNQILNISQVIPVTKGCSEQQSLYGVKLDMCNSLENAYSRDIVVVTSAGNDQLPHMLWPANNNNVIGVAGISNTGSLWNKTTCNNGGQLDCGTNFDHYKTKYAAPADNILVQHPAGDYNVENSCLDSNFASSQDGYQRCSGTSFSAPMISAVVAMIRSLNPLVSVDDVKQILWDAKVPNLPDQRYAVPQADKAVEITLGISNGEQVVNRLTPMFRMRTQNSSQQFNDDVSYLSTSIPQVAVAAKFGTYLTYPRRRTGRINTLGSINYQSGTYNDVESPVVTGYGTFKYEHHTTEIARAPFFVFGGHRNPFNNNIEDLVPLYRMGKKIYIGYEGICNRLPNHAYSTTKNNGILSTHFCDGPRFKFEGIDGFLLPDCPIGMNCYETTGNPSDLQCLTLKYSVNKNSFALMMISEENKTIFGGFGNEYKDRFGNLHQIKNLRGMGNAECLGYVFPNVDSDSDGIINGMELVLGTDPYNPDSDNDGIDDGIEYPLAGIPLSDPMDIVATSSYSDNLSQPTLDFSFVSNGDSSSRDIIVSNAGDGDLQVSCSVNNANFSVSGCPINIPGSSSITDTITVTCNPLTVSSTTTLLGVLSITTNDPNQATVNHSLNCTALSADAVFADSAEPITTTGSCNLSKWSGWNFGFTAASPSSAPRYNGVCAMLQSGPALIMDKNPLNETRLRGRFYFFAEPSGGGDGVGTIELFSGIINENSLITVFKLVFDGTQVVYNSDDGGINASANVSSTEWHSVEFDWNQNGQVSLWVDSDARYDPADAIGTSGNVNSVINAISFGHPALIDNDYSRIIFDEYESHRTTAIGRLIKADSNGNDVVTIGDVIQIKREILNNIYSYGTPDCNEDGIVNVVDISCAINIVLGN